MASPVTPEASDDDVSLYFTPGTKPRTLSTSRSDVWAPMTGLQSLLESSLNRRRSRLAPSEESSLKGVESENNSDDQTVPDVLIPAPGTASIKSGDHNEPLYANMYPDNLSTISLYSQDSFLSYSSYGSITIDVPEIQQTLRTILSETVQRTSTAKNNRNDVARQNDVMNQNNVKQPSSDVIQQQNIASPQTNTLRNDVTQRTDVKPTNDVIYVNYDDIHNDVTDAGNWDLLRYERIERDVARDDVSVYETPPMPHAGATMPLITVQSATPSYNETIANHNAESNAPIKSLIERTNQETEMSHGKKGFSFRKRMSQLGSGKDSRNAATGETSTKKPRSKRTGFRGITPMQNVVLKQMSGYRPAATSTVTKETSLSSDIQSSAKPPPPPTKRRLMSVYQDWRNRRHSSSVFATPNPITTTADVHRQATTNAQVHHLGASSSVNAPQIRNHHLDPHTPAGHEGFGAVRSVSQYRPSRRRINFTPSVFSSVFRGSGVRSGSCDTIPSLTPSAGYTSVFHHPPNEGEGRQPDNDVLGGASKLIGTSSDSYCGKMVRTCCLVAAYMVVGMSFAILGPTLLDIAEFTEASIQQATQLFTSRGAGTMFGSVLSGVLFDHFNYYLTFAVTLLISGVLNFGVLFDHFNYYLTFAVTLLISGVLNFVMPLVANYPAVMVLVFVQGIMLGFLDAACNVLCVYIWGPDNASYMQAMHFLYGVGSIIGPLIAEPFLREQLEESSSSELLAALTNTSLTTVSNIPYIDNDAFTLSGLESNASDASAEMNESFQFYFAYFILGSLGVLSAMFMLLIWAVGEGMQIRAPVLVMQTNDSGATNRILPSKQICIIVLLISLFHFFHMGTEISYKGLVSTFSVKALDWTRKNAAWLAAACFTAYTVGRGIGILVAKRISPVPIIIVNLVLMLASLVLELVLVYRHEAVLWVTASVHGFGQSTVLPSSLTWLDELIDVNSKIAGILMLGASAGMLVIPGLVGWLMDSRSTMYFVTLHLASVCIMVVIFILLYSYSKRTGSKYDQNTTGLAAQSPLSPSKTEGSLDENHNNQKRPLSPRSASLVRNCTHLQEHPEFTGTPLVFNTSGTPYMEAGLQGSMTAQAGSIIRQRSSRVNRGLRVDQPFAQRRSVVRSPYAMGGHTPLILMTFLDK